MWSTNDPLWCSIHWMCSIIFLSHCATVWEGGRSRLWPMYGNSVTCVLYYNRWPAFLYNDAPLTRIIYISYKFSIHKSTFFCALNNEIIWESWRFSSKYLFCVYSYFSFLFSVFLWHKINCSIASNLETSKINLRASIFLIALTKNYTIKLLTFYK